MVINLRIGNIERFKHPDSLANFFGLTPGCNNSGENAKRLGSITKRGSRLVRHLLNQVVMRRLATILWHMLKENRNTAERFAARRRCSNA